MQISVPFAGKLNEDGVNAILPDNYSAEALSSDLGVLKFSVTPNSSREEVGTVEVGNGQLLFRFYADSKAANDYVSAFGLAHPDYDPKKVYWGIVYSVEPGKFQLNKQPWQLFGQAFEEAKHVGTSNSYLVMFYQGEWEKNSLTIVSMQKILPGGQLLMNTGPATLELGDIENERTM